MFSEGLGRLFNAHAPGDDVYISLKDAAAATFFIFEVDGATQAQFTFSSDAAGTATSTPSVIDHYYGKSADVSAGVWHRTAMSAGSLVTPADGTEDLAAVTILATMCPDGKPYVKCNVDAGTVFVVLHDLAYQRDPANLRSVTA